MQVNKLDPAFQVIQTEMSHGPCPIKLQQPAKFSGPSGCSYSRFAFLILVIFLNCKSIDFFQRSPHSINCRMAVPLIRSQHDV